MLTAFAAYMAYIMFIEGFSACLTMPDTCVGPVAVMSQEGQS